MDDREKVPSNTIFTDDTTAMDKIDNIRPDSETPLILRKNDPAIRVVLPAVFVETISLPTSINVEKIKVSVKRPTDSTLKPIMQVGYLITCGTSVYARSYDEDNFWQLYLTI